MYPEHDKLQTVENESRTIGRFLEWLGDEKEILLGKEVDPCEECDRYIEEERFHIEATLAEYFGIDLVILEQEKQAMLDSIRQGEIK